MKIVKSLAIKLFKMKAIALAACFLSASIAYTQDSCLNNTVIKTSSVGNGNDSVALNLQFTLARDSVTIGDGSVQASHKVIFKVINRTCNWDKDFKKGESNYNVEAMPARKKAVLKIIVSDARRVIELLYDNTEPRIFNIATFSLQ